MSLHPFTCHCAECDAPPMPELREFACAICGLIAEHALDDEPERCSCGSAYDMDQYRAEYAEDLQSAIDFNQARHDDAAWARHENRRGRA